VQREGPENPGDVAMGFLEVAEQFGLIASSGGLWAIAADYLEDADGHLLLASAMRAGIYTPAPAGAGAGYGAGYGAGAGAGDGDGAGYGDGAGDGDGAG
jgi:hypothetical protein